MNRKQLSLKIADNTLYENFIKPYGDSGELNAIIIRCLSKYYYDAEVRAKIDDITPEEQAERAENIRSTQTIINEMRQALSIQSFYASTLEDEIQSGAEGVQDILSRTSQMAEDEGCFKTEESSFGNTVARIVDRTSIKSEGVTDFNEVLESMVSKAKSGDYAGAFESVADTQSKIMKMLSELMSQVKNSDSKSDIKPETSSEVAESEVPFPTDDFVANYTEPSVEKAETEVSEPVITPVEPVPEPVQEPIQETESTSSKSIDGSDRLAELLGSMF